METKLQKVPETIQINKRPSIGSPRQMNINPNQHGTNSVDDIQVRYGMDELHVFPELSYPQWAKIYTRPGQKLRLRYGVNPNSQNELLCLRKNYTIPITIQGLNVKNYLCSMFCHMYPKYVSEISEYFSNVAFQEIPESNLSEKMPYYEESLDKRLIVHYSSNLSCYKKIPNMKEDFKKDSGVNLFMAVMVHEFGHLIQEKILKYKKSELGEALHEHHNVLFHENRYPGRKRGFYNPFNKNDFQDYFQRNEIFYKISRVKSVNERKIRLKKGILKLQDPQSVTKENFSDIIKEFKKILRNINQSDKWQEIEKMNIITLSTSLRAQAQTPSPASQPSVLQAQSTSQSSSIPNYNKIPIINIYNFKQIAVFSEIINELSQKPDNEIGQRECDFLRSLMFMLIQNTDTYAWYHDIFVAVMCNVFHIDDENYDDLEMRYWYENIPSESPNEKEKGTS